MDVNGKTCGNLKKNNEGGNIWRRGKGGNMKENSEVRKIGGRGRGEYTGD